MRTFRLVALLAALTVGVLAVSAAAFAQVGPNPRPLTWVDGELFAGVVTPATFDPANGNFDELYTCGTAGTFKDEVPLISESGPGDQDYNGGRWHLNVLEEGATCPSTADGVDDLNLDDFAPTNMYFECPLLPRRGNT